jgi:cytochrome b
MSTLNPSVPRLEPAPAATKPPSRRVVDAPIRMFHWLFALCFVGAYITADGESWRLLHVTLGYTLAGLLGFRLVYGVIGPRHARLSLMWRKLVGLPAWLALFKWSQPGKVNWLQGQNLVMALAVVALLLVVIPVTLSGYLNYNDVGGELMEDLHETVGELFLWLVLAHLALIAGLSVLRRKNQALPMLTGRTPGAGPDLVKSNKRWLAALLLLGVLTYWGWEWQQSPAGLLEEPGTNTVFQGGGYKSDH